MQDLCIINIRFKIYSIEHKLHHNLCKLFMSHQNINYHYKWDFYKDIPYLLINKNMNLDMLHYKCFHLNKSYKIIHISCKFCLILIRKYQQDMKKLQYHCINNNFQQVKYIFYLIDKKHSLYHKEHKDSKHKCNHLYNPKIICIQQKEKSKIIDNHIYILSNKL